MGDPRSLARAESPVPKSVASITVAYNSAASLPRQIEALRRQLQPLHEIIVVDNASTDKTTAILAERYPDVTVLRMSRNLGAAGAWASGLHYAAMERKHDWIWTFDDDSVPDEDSLSKLLAGVGFTDGLWAEIGIIAPMPVHRETGTRYPPLFWQEGFVRPSEMEIQAPLWFADMVIASGSLIRREVIEKIGLPRADFFMDFFDFEYSLRARSYGYKIAIVAEAKLRHQIGDAREIWFLGRPRLWTSYAPWREYYLTRNLAYAGWHLYPTSRTKRFVCGHLLRHAGAVILFSAKKLATLQKMVQGFSDGRRAKLGIRFTPNEPRDAGHAA